MNYEDMISILEHMHTYVPKVSFTEVFEIDGMEVQHEDHRLLTTLVGGDQLSVARVRGSQLIRANSETNVDRLNGLLPIAEDWHAKVVFIEVSEHINTKTTYQL